MTNLTSSESTVRADVSGLQQAGPNQPAPVMTVASTSASEAAQDELAALSTNSVHRVLANAEHTMLPQHQATAAESGQAIRDVINAVRTATPLAGR